MKLKQFYLALSVATVLSACSNEDNLPPEPVDAYISLSLSSQPTALRSATKADGDKDSGTDGEKRITEVATLLFDNATEKLVAFKDTVLPPADLSKKDVTISEVNNIHVKVLPAAEGKASDTKFKMVVVANSNDLVKGVASLKELKEKVTPDITDYTPEKVNTNTPGTDTKYLPMISGVLDVSGIIPEKPNVVGADGKVVAATTSSPIIVTRRVARVQLDQLTVNFTDKSYGSFTPDSFFVVNIRKNSLLMSATGSNLESIELTSAPFIHGGPANGFVPSQGLIDPSGKYETGFGIKAELKKLENNNVYNANVTSPIFQCYVYENLIGTKGATAY
ncbi:MAG: fimbrial protein, partial [Tannerellaceae bacterium]